MTHQHSRSAILTTFLKAAFGSVLFLMLCLTTLYGQVLMPAPGMVDEGFGRTGTVKTNYQFGVNNRLKQVVFQPDGKMIAIGTRSYSQQYPRRFLLVRLDSKGRFDLSFGSGGYSSIPFADSTNAYNDNTDAHAAALQADGKVLVAGTIGVGTLDIVLARYLVDGSLDTTFGTAGVVRTDLGRFQENSQEIASRIFALPTGKILVVGQKFSMNRFSGQYMTDLVLIRYNVDGSIDESFANFGIVLTRMSLNRYVVTGAKIDDDGCLFVTSFGTEQTPRDPGPYFVPIREGLLLKYDPNGVLDPTFADAGILKIAQPERTDFEVVKMLPKGQLIVHEHGRLVRRNQDGTLDSVILPAEFVVDGRTFQASSHLLQENGKIVSYGYGVIYIDGSAWQLYPAIVRHRAGGQIDEQFGTNGLAHGAFEGNQWESQLFLQPDGKIMEAGNSFLGSNVFFLSRYHGDLPIEPTETLKH